MIRKMNELNEKNMNYVLPTQADEPLKRGEVNVNLAKAIAKRLEDKYASRNLKFTSPFEGLEPVQAYGYLDGLRFYFRFRGRIAKLNIGPFDQQIEDLTILRYQEKDKAKALENQPQNVFEPTVISESDPEFYPIRVTQSSTVTWLSGKGSTFDLFSALIDSLSVVDEGNQVEESTKVYLFEGLEAAKTYWASR